MGGEMRDAGFGIRVNKFVSSFMNHLSFTSVFLAQDSQTLLPSDSQTRIPKLKNPHPETRLSNSLELFLQPYIIIFFRVTFELCVNIRTQRQNL